jgi:hypothetical protein
VLLTTCDSIYACGYEIGEVAIPGNDRDDVANNLKRIIVDLTEREAEEITVRASAYVTPVSDETMNVSCKASWILRCQLKVESDRQTLVSQDPVLAVSASQTEENSGLTPMLTLMK